MRIRCFKYILIALLWWIGGSAYGQEGGVEDLVGSAKKYMLTHANDSALRYLNRALLIHANQTLPDSTLQEVYSLLAVVYRREGMEHKALNYSTKVLAIAQSIGDSTEIYKASVRIGIAYAISKEYGRGVKHFKWVLKYGQRMGDSNLMAATRANIGACLVDSGLMAEGLAYVEEALTLRESLFKRDSVGNYRQLSGLYFNMAEAHQHLGQFEKALILANESYAIRKNLNWDRGMAANAVQFTKYFIVVGDIEQAGAWLDSCRKYRDVLPKKRQSYIELAADYFELTQQYEKAFEYLKQYRFTEDSMNQVLEADKLLFARIDYEVQEARNRLTLLEKENSLSEVRLYNTNLQRIALLLLLLAAIAVGVVVFRQLRQKARYARELAHKNSEVELLLKELQHRVKNNMQAVAGMFELTLERITHPEARTKLMEFKGSLTAMMLIQKRLYSDKGMSDVTLSEFLDEFLWTILDMYGVRDEVELSTQFEDFKVSGDFATKFGLVCSELLSNSLKHGFPLDYTDAKIWLQLNLDDDGCKFIYRDNGVGFNYDEMRGSGSLGLTVVSSLTRELKGAISFDPNTFSFTFKFNRNAYLDS